MIFQIIGKPSLTIKNSDFNSVGSVSFLKGLTHEFGKKENEISPLCVMFDDLFLENKPSWTMKAI